MFSDQTFLDRNHRHCPMLRGVAALLGDFPAVDAAEAQLETFLR